jgi:hypothetical protein
MDGSTQEPEEMQQDDDDNRHTRQPEDDITKHNVTSARTAP